MKNDSKTILITGASSGFGRDMVRLASASVDKGRPWVESPPPECECTCLVNRCPLIA